MWQFHIFLFIIIDDSFWKLIYLAAAFCCCAIFCCAACCTIIFDNKNSFAFHMSFSLFKIAIQCPFWALIKSLIIALGEPIVCRPLKQTYLLGQRTENHHLMWVEDSIDADVLAPACLPCLGKLFLHTIFIAGPLYINLFIIAKH